MCFSAASYRSRINRRLAIAKDRTDRESVLVELRRERGLTGGGDYRIGLIALNRLILQSGLTLGVSRLLPHRRRRQPVRLRRHLVCRAQPPRKRPWRRC